MPSFACAHLGLLPAETVDTGSELHGAQGLSMLGWRVRDVSDHGGAAASGCQGLTEQQAELVVPGDGKRGLRG